MSVRAMPTSSDPSHAVTLGVESPDEDFGGLVTSLIVARQDVVHRADVHQPAEGVRIRDVAEREHQVLDPSRVGVDQRNVVRQLFRFSIVAARLFTDGHAPDFGSRKFHVHGPDVGISGKSYALLLGPGHNVGGQFFL